MRNSERVRFSNFRKINVLKDELTYGTRQQFPHSHNHQNESYCAETFKKLFGTSEVKNLSATNVRVNAMNTPALFTSNTGINRSSRFQVESSQWQFASYINFGNFHERLAFDESSFVF